MTHDEKLEEQRQKIARWRQSYIKKVAFTPTAKTDPRIVAALGGKK